MLIRWEQIPTYMDDALKGHTDSQAWTRLVHYYETSNLTIDEFAEMGAKYWQPGFGAPKPAKYITETTEQPYGGIFRLRDQVEGTWGTGTADQDSRLVEADIRLREQLGFIGYGDIYLGKTIQPLLVDGQVLQNCMFAIQPHHAHNFEKVHKLPVLNGGFELSGTFKPVTLPATISQLVDVPITAVFVLVNSYPAK